MLEKSVLTILGLNCNQRLGRKKTKINICHDKLTSSTQLQNRSFHVVERTITSSKCQKMKNARVKRAKNTVFHCQICKFVTFLLLSSSWLLKLPSETLNFGIKQVKKIQTVHREETTKLVISSVANSHSSKQMTRCLYKARNVSFIINLAMSKPG